MSGNKGVSLCGMAPCGAGSGGEVWVGWGGVGRVGRCGEVWGGMGKYGEVWGGVGREITVATASCGEGRRVCGGEPEQDFSYMFIHIHTYTHSHTLSENLLGNLTCSTHTCTIKTICHA